MAETTHASGLSVVYRNIRDLTPFARNARKHTAKQIRLLRSSLAQYGWTNPMLIADDVMIAGHGRLKAALDMARDNQPIANNPDPWTGPTIDLSHLSPADRDAYRLMDNKSAIEATWDAELLRMEFDSLELAGFDLLLTGFGGEELNTLRGESSVGGRQLRDSLSYQIIVECADETQQAELLASLRAEGLACKPLIV